MKVKSTGTIYNIEIGNIPESIDIQNDKLEDLVIDVLAKANVPDVANEIHACHRLQKIDKKEPP